MRLICGSPSCPPSAATRVRVIRANLKGSVPPFTVQIPVSLPEWNYNMENKFKPKIEYMLKAIAKQRGGVSPVRG